MKVIIVPWIECDEKFKEFDIPINAYVDLSDSQIERITDEFDVKIIYRKIDLEKDQYDKVMYLSPRGRGFGQR